MVNSNLHDKIKNNFFIGIGSQRGGTTWLGEFLSTHPEVSFSPHKELHYFDTKYLKICKKYDLRFETKLIKKVEKIKKTGLKKHTVKQLKLLIDRLEMRHNEDAYIKYFENIYNGEKISGEISPSYSMLNEYGFSQIKRMIPNVKIIYILRNPIDRFWSQILLNHTRKSNFNPIEVFEEKLKDKNYYRRTAYHSTIKAIEKVFDPSQIHILFFENIFDVNTRFETVKGITDFLDIKFIEPKFGTVVNSSKKVALPDELRKIGVNRFKKTYQYIQKRNEAIPEKWIKDMALLRK